MLYQLTYVSTVSPGANINLDKILEVSIRNNTRDGLSGLLIFHGYRFLQALEGDTDKLMKCFERITAAETEHRAIVTISAREIPERQFGDWSMAFCRVPPVAGERSLITTVDALTASVENKNTRELFRSFARIERKAA